jgi:DNA-binding transcriptional ArsR family regulator
MVNYSEQSLDAIFSALSDATRRAILARLAKGDLTVGELAEPFDMSLPAVSKHLRVLERAGLLVQEKDGRIRRCHLNAEPLKTAAQWINFYRQFWEDQFGQLAAFLEETYDTDKPDEAS